jgi:hypothetical protein
MGPGRLAAEYLQTAGRKVGDVMTAEADRAFRACCWMSGSAIDAD